MVQWCMQNMVAKGPKEVLSSATSDLGETNMEMSWQGLGWD